MRDDAISETPLAMVGGLPYYSASQTSTRPKAKRRHDPRGDIGFDLSRRKTAFDLASTDDGRGYRAMTPRPNAW